MNSDSFIKPKNEDGSQPHDLLEACLETLKAFLDYPLLVQKHGEEVKKRLFHYQVAELVDKAKLEDQAKQSFSKIKPTGRKHQVIPFMSYEDLHSQFGGDATGYEGESEWCHTNGESTYESWTENFKKFFFVIAEDGWESIKPHSNPKEDDNAYDEYGLSLIAILVSCEGELLKCTLRWNHVVEPKHTLPGRAVDNAFTSYAELFKVTGLDVEAEVKRELAKIIEKVNKIPNGKKMYEGPEGICFVIDHLYWYDKDFNLIDPPDEIHGGFNF